MIKLEQTQKVISNEFNISTKFVLIHSNLVSGHEKCPTQITAQIQAIVS